MHKAPRIPVWWSQVTQLACQTRGDWESGPVDLEDLCRRHGIAITEREMGAMGLNLGSDSVQVNASLPTDLKRLTLAHEIGHALVRRSFCAWLSVSDEERFCDAFARELLVPASVLNDISPDDARKAADLYQVTTDAVLLQLATLGKVEALVRTSDGAILCLACGDRRRLHSCACIRVRGDRSQSVPCYAIPA